MAKDRKVKKAVDWYKNNRERYTELANNVENIIKEMLIDKDIYYITSDSERASDRLSTTFEGLITEKGIKKYVEKLSRNPEFENISVLTNATLCNTTFQGDVVFNGASNFLKNVSLEQTLLKAEEIRKNIEQNHWPENLKITVSIGVTTIRTDDSIEALQTRMDELMYQAKSKGRNCCVSD